MKSLIGGFLFFTSAICVFGQAPAPIGILRGSIVDPLPQRSPGVLHVKADDGNTYNCSLDHRTYMERRDLRVALVALQSGDQIEAVTDRRNGDCYARTVKVIDFEPARPGRAAVQRRERPTESFAPRGYLTFGGLVVRRTDELMVVRTRTDGTKTLLLRNDTRFFKDGQPVPMDDLQVNTRVFIRAGHNFERDLEAYHVSWGGIVHSPEQ